MPANTIPDSQSLKGKRVLITGGLGFIGSNLAHACVAQGAKVTIYDCLDPRSGGNMHNVHEIEHDLEIILNDIRNFEGLSAALRKQEIVFNCAAYTSHPLSMREPLTDIDVNCKGTINLLEATRRFSRDCRIVHIGTSTQVGKMVQDPVTETHPEFPVDIYSANKSVSEKYILIYGTAYKMPVTVVRLANNFGPRSNIQSPEFGFVNYFVGLALKGCDITVFGDGAQKRNISFIDDSVRALTLAATSDKCLGQTLFAVENRQTTVAQIAQAIAGAIGGKVRFVEWPKDRQVIEIGDAVISNAKAKKLLGWNPQTNLQDALAATRAYFDSCLEKYL